ncbi:tRNA (cytidine(34)-2'-O)-methyltransferase [Streptomyces sp. NP160]|uniref:tRNA (cytidine(34)-2'-O)-methyltransferase n=1 Tax=Streptomyces sp. NP160 TaxID=2586637 RepID=UPI00111B988C|nr:tRNA (cytidine(34)-2'-O)-methyltransferase [Streptomyces sp. NP160]TNM59289.1 tRNA (cytidine(34)-2'-O)-methyltransferase [Streptomyces sp. NP160]
MFHVVLVEPEIPGNAGAAIRLSATTGAHLHLVRPLGFDLEDSKLRRAGLDYHDLARTTVHDDVEALWAALADLGSRRAYALTSSATRWYTDVAYEPGDALLFGRESVGLPEHVVADPRTTDRLRIPMLPQRRSLNASNAVAVVVHEAWRQHAFAGGA